MLINGLIGCLGVSFPEAFYNILVNALKPGDVLAVTQYFLAPVLDIDVDKLGQSVQNLNNNGVPGGLGQGVVKLLVQGHVVLLVNIKSHLSHQALHMLNLAVRNIFHGKKSRFGFKGFSQLADLKAVYFLKQKHHGHGLCQAFMMVSRNVIAGALNAFGYPKNFQRL